MSNLQSDIVLSSRVRLARNYEDIPFSPMETQGNAILCEQRTLNALSLENEDEGYTLYCMREMSDAQKRYLAERHLLSFDLIRNSPMGSAFIHEKRQVSIMINEEDHLRIQSIARGQQLSSTAKLAYEVEDALQKHVRFAFDTRLGYLTACPTNTGTGMRASLMLHLPMLTITKQMGAVNQIVAKLGLTIRGIYGEGSEALGNLYQVSNQATLGRTEEELIEAVNAVAKQLLDMERALRLKADKDDPVKLEDSVLRSFGLLKYARRMSQKEFMQHWSALRVGACLCRIPLSLEKIDELLEKAQDAHIMKWAGEDIPLESLNEARSQRIRKLLV